MNMRIEMNSSEPAKARLEDVIYMNMRIEMLLMVDNQDVIYMNMRIEIFTKPLIC